MQYGSNLIIPLPDEQEAEKIKSAIEAREARQKRLGRITNRKQGEDDPDTTMNKDLQNRASLDEEQRLEEQKSAIDFQNFKRAHFFFTCVGVSLLLMIKLEFTYTSIFRSNVSIFLVVFMVIDIVLEQILSRIVLGEALLLSPILGYNNPFYFIGVSLLVI